MFTARKATPEDARELARFVNAVFHSAGKYATFVVIILFYQPI